jgi:hypothetical protein
VNIGIGPYPDEQKYGARLLEFACGRVDEGEVWFGIFSHYRGISFFIPVTSQGWRERMKWYRITREEDW